VVLCLALAATGARAELASFEPNLHRGNVRVGGDISLTGVSFANGASSYNLVANLPVQYFLFDGLTLGGAVGWQTAGSTATSGVSQSTTSFSVGAESAWYFWTYGRMAARVQPEIWVYFSDSRPTTWQAAGALGVEWFFTRSVSFGPGVLYAHTFQADAYPSSDLYRFFVDFNIYL
jgi:hypothetical protein